MNRSGLHNAMRCKALLFRTTLPFVCIVLGIGLVHAAAPKLVVPAEILIGESPQIRAINLASDREYVIRAEMTDAVGRKWESSAAFAANALGELDLASSHPIRGDYEDHDVFGLIWSMKLQADEDANEAPENPREFNSLRYRLIDNGRELDLATTKQWIIPRGLKSERIADGLTAEMFFDPNINGARPGILVLGGSGGGMYWARRQAALLAKEGYCAMALSYFNDEGLPKHLAQVPLEYVEKAVKRLADQPQTDKTRIGLMGYSKGAELSLLVGSRMQEIKTVVAYAPASAVFQGFKPPKYPVISSWTVEGNDLPFVPNAYDKKFFETRDGMYLWYRTLRQYEAMENAAIPVEKINGNVLLVSGAKDTIWPSTLMGEQIIGRLRLLGLKDKCTHLVFGDAGHGIAAPPGEPVTRVANRLGGTPYGNALARRVGWNFIKDFLSQNLKSGVANLIDRRDQLPYRDSRP